MSSINMDKNLNNNLEQGQIEVDPIVEIKDECDTEDRSSIHGVAVGGNVRKFSPDVHKDCNSPISSETKEDLLSQPQDLDKNLNTVDTCTPDNTAQKAEPECDTNNTVDVENIANTLAENRITDCETISDNCDSTSDKKPNNSVTTKVFTEKIIQDNLIHKVNELDISGRVNQNIQNNKSGVILKKETDSLRNLLVYDNSSDEEDFEKNWQVLSVPDNFSEESESDSSESEETSSDDDDIDDITTNIIYGQTNKGAIKKNTKTTTEGGSKALSQVMDVLPPVPKLSTLNINYDTEEFLVMGHIQGVIDTLVTIEAIPGSPAYDLDTYLFIQDKCSKKPLGAIDDVIGPVSGPFYCVRFNTAKEIQDLNIKIGLKVYSAPKSQYTHYVFVKELMKIKGSDASWVGDSELPPEVAAELSDDGELETVLETVCRAQKRKHSSLERHKQFEKSMNHCNTLNTRVAQLVDAHRRLPRPARYSDQPQRSLMNEFQLYDNRPPVPFDPTVPPPGFYNYPRENSTQIRPSMHWGWVPPLYRSSSRSSSTPSTQGQNNSANYYTNNAGRNHAAGPSTQPY